MATQMLEGLKINFDEQPTASQRHPTRSQDAMDIDSESSRFSFTQPETPINDVMFDWERPQRVNAHAFSSSQPTSAREGGICTLTNGAAGQPFDEFADEPCMSQFTPAQTAPLSLTQHARRFGDIVPSYSLTRFFSHLPAAQLLQLLGDALHQLNVPTPPTPHMQGRDHAAWIKVRTTDGRKCHMNGDIVVDTYQTNNIELLEVRFVKVKGDPLEWRRFFKKVCVICREGIYVPGG